MTHSKVLPISLGLLILALVLLPASSLTASNAKLPSLSPETSQTQYPFQNPDLSIEERVANIISLLTIEEKIACLGTNPSVPRLGIKGSGHVEGIHGLTQGGPAKWGRPKTIPTTTFPQGIGLGETWDAEIVRQAAAVEGFEARYVFQSPKYQQGGIVIRSPNADLGRDPRWGRTEECYGEDAYFNGMMTVAFVKGLQGDHPKYWLSAALMKHFLANSNENGRGSSSSNFDERLFREYYSVPFRMGVLEGGSRAFMASYNAVNGVPMHVNPILKNVARKEWGQDGIICTDGGGMRLLATDHKYSPDFDHATASVIKAGIGQFLDNYRDAARNALKRGLLTEKEIDEALKGNFRVMIRLGLLDPPALVPYSTIGTEPEDPWLRKDHQALAKLATQKSIVLLKNSNNALPLDKARLKSIAVLGPRANEVLLDWYSGTPPYRVSALEGIKNKVGANVAVRSAVDSDEAVKLAQASDVAIVCVGNHPNGGHDNEWGKVSVPSEGREAVDRESITLEQEELIKRVYAANPRTIVVLVSSFPYAINWSQENIPAIVHMALNSQEEGNALADVLFGDYNPAGRLVQTWPSSLAQLPPIMDYDIRHGRTYMYFNGQPLYPFGYGLSYTSFAYSNLRTSSGTLPGKGTVAISLDVKNTGTRAGEEVVQMYVKHLDSAVARPLKELKGFKRVAIAPGQTISVTLPLTAERLAYWDATKHAFVVEKGRVQVMVGSSSADTRLSKPIRVTP
jgi:beta-glucosidase